uniref:Phosphotyrosine protein phosphatase I domain-containing protein n=1 Tax=Neovison vison TaxID=452646 RepID=A0A8C7B1R8_NEOVI
MAEKVPTSVVFVCLGNICQSPIAEAVFRKLVIDQKGRIGSLTDTGSVLQASFSSLTQPDPPPMWQFF